jgi:hypothetical protein
MGRSKVWLKLKELLLGVPSDYACNDPYSCCLHQGYDE